MFATITSNDLLYFTLIASGAIGLWFPTIGARHGEGSFNNYEIPAACLVSLAELLVGIALALIILPPMTALIVIVGAIGSGFILIEIVRRPVQIVWLVLQAGLMAWMMAALMTAVNAG